MTVIDFRKWSPKGWTELAELVSEWEWGEKKLYAQQRDGVWHYAIVHWLNGIAIDVVEFANGKVRDE